MRATIIYNPLAGPADMATTIDRVADFWRERGWKMNIRPTQYAGHAVKLAREAAGQRLVLAAGGDGTLGEVANGLAHTDAIMAPLPTGTGNSFGKELRMPRPNLIDHRGLVEAAAMLASGRVQQMDLGQIEGGKYWMLWTGTGIDGYVVERIEPRSKLSKRLGPFGYVSQAMAIAPQFPPMAATVEVDGQRFEGAYVLIVVSNCRRFGGGEVLLSRDAALDDGLFEVWLFRGEGFPQALRYLWLVWRGQHFDDPDAQMVRGRVVSVRTDSPVAYHTDGDPAGHTPLTCEIAPRALRVLIPRSAPDGLFSRPGTPL